MRALQAIRKINPMAAMFVETALFNLAGEQLEGYSGGSWTSKRVGDFWVAVPPCAGKAHMQVAENFADVTTTAVSAGAALTLAALNHTIWHVHNKYGDRASGVVNALSDLYHNMKNAVLSDSKTFDTAAIATLCD